MGPEKRLPLALFLCFVILVGWRAVFPPPPVENGGDGGQEQVEGVTPPDAGVQPGTGAPVTPPAPDPNAVEPWDEWIELGAPDEPGHLHTHFHSLGGSVAEIRFANYFVEHGLGEEERADMQNRVALVVPGVEPERTLHTFMLRNGPSADDVLESDLASVHWQHERIEGGVRFTHEDASGVVFVKTIEKVPGEYQFRVTLTTRVANDVVAGRRATVHFVSSVGMRQVSGDSFYQEPKAVAATRGRDPQQRMPDIDGTPRKKALVNGEVSYFGTHNKYFALLARPADDVTRAVLQEADWLSVFDTEFALANPGGGKENRFRDVLVEGVLSLTLPREVGAEDSKQFIVYAGPKDAQRFGPGDEIYGDILRKDLGFFDGIAGVILGFLRFLHGIVGNWGWAIIVLTLCVRGLLFPLNRRMQTSMARHATKMKRVQPKIDAIKKKYEKDPQRLRQEQAKVFAEEGAMPPLGGCLPIFLQIPIFFGLFSALRVAFDLRQEPFLGWIEDLSQPDRLFRMDLPFPFIGPIEYFNLLPILMVVMWVGQQKVMPKPAADNEQARQMQKIMMWMPIMFGFFLYNYAAGLSLYMITTSLFGIIEMTVIRRIWPIDDSEQPKKQSKFRARMAELQKRVQEQQEAQQRMQQQQRGGSRKKKK